MNQGLDLFVLSVGVVDQVRNLDAQGFVFKLLHETILHLRVAVLVELFCDKCASTHLRSDSRSYDRCGRTDSCCTLSSVCMSSSGVQALLSIGLALFGTFLESCFGTSEARVVGQVIQLKLSSLVVVVELLEESQLFVIDGDVFALAATTSELPHVVQVTPILA